MFLGLFVFRVQQPHKRRSNRSSLKNRRPWLSLGTLLSHVEKKERKKGGAIKKKKGRYRKERPSLSLGLYALHTNRSSSHTHTNTQTDTHTHTHQHTHRHHGLGKSFLGGGSGRAGDDDVDLLGGVLDISGSQRRGLLLHLPLHVLQRLVRRLPGPGHLPAALRPGPDHQLGWRLR